VENITVEELEKQIRRAAHCESVRLPADQFIALAELAMRAAGIYSSSAISRMQKIIGEAEVTLTGDEIRSILDLALQAKLLEKSSANHD
jgi:hypothetical protein